jgi:hypothetical protein
VLRAMLTAPMREQITGRILLPNIALDTGLGLISFLYNGQMEPGSDYEGLLELAEKYDIKVCYWCLRDTNEIWGLAKIFEKIFAKSCAKKYIHEIF